MSGDDSSGGERKAPPKKARSPAASAPSSVSMLAQVLERVPALVAAHCLNDPQLLQLSQCLLTAPPAAAVWLCLSLGNGQIRVHRCSVRWR